MSAIPSRPKSKPKFLYQVSSGGVLFKQLNLKIKICLIARRTQGKVVWCLPKGHVESKESLQAAALREVREETGISGSIVSPLGFITYQFYDSESKSRIFKKVYFFLIRYRAGKTSDHDDEVEMVRWHSPDEALNKIQYPSECGVLKKAIKKLELCDEKNND